VAAGLSHIMRAAHGKSLFCGDAIADPLTGLHAALAAFAAWRTGRGGLFSVALRDVVAHCSLFHPPPTGWRARASEWHTHLIRGGIDIAPPHARPVHTKAALLGADTDRVLREFTWPKKGATIFMQ
jgi:crotonobetainyl-CoA:carnitine CoA-transferase CaiB-like acyl-CoA transferase